MFSFAIIVFREVLEVALTLSILLAATRGIKGRFPWISSGLSLGAVGALIVAFFAEEIASAFSGAGQEIFNASVLLISAVLIGMTVVWMARAGKTLSRELKQVGCDVLNGVRPKSVLCTIIGISMLRDGSEIVLLAHGMLAGGLSTQQLVLGFLLGVGAGSLVGFGIYFGLIRSATRWIFAVTSWTLVFLSAGMVAQAINFLSAADLMPQIVYPLWDTSAILSDQSFLGQTLHMLIGYTSRPSGAQCLFYALTVIIVCFALRVTGSAQQSTVRLPIAISTMIIFFVVLHAGKARAADNIYSPAVYKDELEIETKGSYDLDHRDDMDGNYEQKFGVGYGITDWFALELYANMQDEPEHSAILKEYAVEGRFELWEQGKYWLDAGLYTELEGNFVNSGYEAEGKILLEKPIGNFVNTTNLIFAEELFEGGSSVEGEIAWVTRYRLDKAIEPAIEAHFNFGELENAGAFVDQGHSVGPAIYGKLTDHIKYEFASLFGISEGAPDWTARVLLEYEFSY